MIRTTNALTLILSCGCLCLLAGCNKPESATQSQADTVAVTTPAADTPRPTVAPVAPVAASMLSKQTHALIAEAVAEAADALGGPASTESDRSVRVGIVKDAVTSLTTGLLADDSLNDAQKTVARQFAETDEFIDRARFEQVKTAEQFDALIRHVSDGLLQLQVRLIEAVEQA